MSSPYITKQVRLLSRAILVSALFAASCSPAKSPTPGVENEHLESRLAPGQHTAVIDGVSIAYHVFGKGPVVMAHPGGPGGGWSYLRMPEVEKLATVVYVEPIGTGASGRLPNPADYSRERDASNVEGLRVHLGIEKLVLLGHSYGGFVALEYALTYPDHLRGLILYDTSPTTGPDFDKDVESNKAWFKNESWYADATSALDEMDSADTDEKVTTIFRRAVPLYVANWTGRHKEFEASVPPIQLYVERSHRQKANTPQIDLKGKLYDVRPRLGEIKASTLIVVGARDFICSEKMANVEHQGIPGSHLVVLQNTGHIAHIETPHEFVQAIGEFLGQLGTEPTASP